ncbi:MAG: glycosyltransferase [Actinomycetota bacterium]|nr:glycosyltransferase [Actinomycetota bacterium]
MPERLSVGILMSDLRTGGAERVVVDTVAGWREMDAPVAVTVITLRDGELRGPLERLGVRVVHSPVRGRMDPRTPIWLRSVLRRDPFDLVHAHHPRVAILARIVAGRAGPPLLYTEHNVLESYHPITRWLNALTYRANARVTTVSGAVLRSVRGHVRYPAARLSVIPNGIDTGRPLLPRAEARAALGFEESDLLVGTVANLRPQKGLDVLVRALATVAADFPGLRAVVLGRDDGEGERLRDLAGALGVSDRVRWEGYRRDARELLPALDLYVVASRAEGSSLAILEAMDAGLPVVATAVGGNPEAVSHGTTGLIVRPERPPELAAAMRTLLADPGRRARMGAAGRARIADGFGARAMSRRYLDLYRAVAGVAE